MKQAEQKTLKKVGKKEIKNEVDDEDSMGENYDEYDEDSEEEEDSDEDLNIDEEESKGEPTEDTLGFMEESKQPEKSKLSADEDTESDYSDELDEMVSNYAFNDRLQYDMNITMDMLNAPFKKNDEFEIFN